MDQEYVVEVDTKYTGEGYRRLTPFTTEGAR
jgi:hypothetical protein